MANEYGWINFYTEFADKLLPYKTSRSELIQRIRHVYRNVGIKFPKLESDNNPKDIDPFTVFGLFNKGISNTNRVAIIKGFASEFGVKAEIPEAFDGIPVLNNLRATFYWFQEDRKEYDIDNLWNLFAAALDYTKDDSGANRQTFVQSYDAVLSQQGIKWNITMGLYWIRPYTFLNLDSCNRSYMSDSENMPVDYVVKIKPLLKEAPAADQYLEIIKLCKAALDTAKYEYRAFPELSYYAWVESKKVNRKQKKAETEKKNDQSNAAHIRWTRPIVQALRNLGGSGTPAEVRAKIVENEHLTEEEISVTRGKTNVNKFENEVAFARNDLVVAGYIDKSTHGVWTLTEAGMTVDITDEMASELFKHTVAESAAKRSRDSEAFAGGNDDVLGKNEDKATAYLLYSVDDFLDEVYIDEGVYDNIVEVLRNKKNIILQGAPGVGKTFVAKRLAYAIMGVKDNDRVMMVQFHQNYSYEDFIMGFRPTTNGFELRKGVFYNFCKKAENDSDNDYFFIIDEINRGNLSKIFGELFMLIENDKRGIELPLQYSDEKFAVPSNVYIIGTMNTADRSLAMLDYALRRRFAFIDIKPGFDSKGFKAYKAGIDNIKFDRLVACVDNLNKAIADDESLGEGFRIGHSYFCNLNPDAVDNALSGIIEYELVPLLKEYWFDEPTKVKDWTVNLRGAIK